VAYYLSPTSPVDQFLPAPDELALQLRDLLGIIVSGELFSHVRQSLF
jgi:hypothetical protein